MFKIKNGFTLIELLIVIAIIGIMASAILVSINAANQKSKKRAGQQTGNSLIKSLKSCQSIGSTTNFPAENSQIGGSVCVSDASLGTYPDISAEKMAYGVSSGSFFSDDFKFTLKIIGTGACPTVTADTINCVVCSIASGNCI